MNKFLFIIVFIFSISLYVIGITYSKQQGFIIGKNADGTCYYSTELMSSGGDDFDIFKLNIRLNIIIAILSLVFFGLYLIFKKTYYKLFLILFSILWMQELIIIILINLDISLFSSIMYGDYLLLLWLTFFFMQIPCIIVSQIKK